MGLYDVISDISNFNSQKTATGDVRIHGVVVGIVAKNYDKNMPGRGCVTIPTRGETNKGDVLKWARVAMPYSGKDWGFYFQPEVGDEVLLVFEQGDIEKPYVIGAIPRSDGSEKSSVMSACFDEKNTMKRIQTKHGSCIAFTDSKDDTKGKKDVISIETPDKEHYIKMDNENDVITVSDKKEKNQITIETAGDKGRITCKCQKKFEIRVGDGIQIIANGETGKVEIKAKSIGLESTQGEINIKSQTGLNVKGQSSVNIKGAAVNVESQGMLGLKGSMVKQG